MSEVLHANATTSEEKAGISRRRVVTGVAWSLPVFVTAVAAPAAAASGLSATAGLVGAGSTATFVRSGGGGGGTERFGTGPTALQIHNSGGAINGTISGTITITPEGTFAAGVGVQSITPAALAAPSYSPTHAFNGTFTYSGGVPNGGTVNFPIQFQYESVNGIPNKVTYSYVMTMTVRLPDGTTQVLTARLTITF